MAVFSSRSYQFLNGIRAMAITHQRNRITFWISRCFLFHIFTLAILGQYSHCVHIIHVCCSARGEMRFTILFSQPNFSSNYRFQFFASQNKDFDPRKKMTEDELANATRLTTILNFEGYWKYSPLFYG